MARKTSAQLDREIAAALAAKSDAAVKLQSIDLGFDSGFRSGAEQALHDADPRETMRQLRSSARNDFERGLLAGWESVWERPRPSHARKAAHVGRAQVPSPAHARKKKLTHQEAKRLLESEGIDFTRDVDATISSMSKGNRVAEVARQAGYRKRKDAPGSTSRMYFQYLSRHSDGKRAKQTTHARKKKLDHQEAKRLLESEGIDFTRDYHAVVSMSQGNRIAEVAKLAGYRKSKTAPGSTARMYFQYLSRLNNHATRLQAGGKTAEWHRGELLGENAALEVTAKHGRLLGERNLESLQANLRREIRLRQAVDFDRGYIVGYKRGISRASGR